MMPGFWMHVAGVALLATVPAFAQEKPAAPTAAPIAKGPRYAMPQTETFDVTSDGGEVYRIFVSYPETEMPKDGYPVLYVLDGNAMFAAFAEARRVQEFYDVGKAIVVGVGYPTDKPYDTRRLNDFTPPMPNPPPPSQAFLAKYKSGGRDIFLDFLTGKLRAEIAKRYQVNPNKQSLFGHSLGGLLALRALYSRPEAFHSIIAASPSLQWNDQGVLKEEREFAARMTSGKIPRISRLMILVGGREDGAIAAGPFADRMKLLAGYGLRSQFTQYDEEGHMSVPARAVTEALRFVFETR